jgi:hypothetical protein
MRDGRLDPTARASFERHSGICDICKTELRALAHIADAMRELPQHAAQEMDRRRARIALLRRANERLSPEGGRSVRAWAVGAVAACVLVVSIAGSRLAAFKHSVVASIHPPTFEIVDAGSASWTTKSTAGTVVVALSDGIAAMHVDHLARDQRFLVRLPDGELEVRGTRFRLSVAKHRTAGLEVTEGAVALRLNGEQEILVKAGQQWAPQAPVTTASPPDGVAESVPAAALPVVAPPRAVARAAESAHPHTQSPAGPAEGTAIDGFAACVSALETGDYAGADHLLATFLRDNPSDARSEDAAFLRSVSHARMGDAMGAAKLAREYLRRYPAGLRRREAEHLAGSGGTVDAVAR